MSKKKSNGFSKYLFWGVPSLLVLILIIIIILFATGVWTFPTSQTIITNTTIIDRLNNPKNLPGVSCSLVLTPNIITLGDSVSGTIKDGINTECEIYFRYVPGVGDIYSSQDWTLDSVVKTNPTGTYTSSRTPDKTGTYTFAVICGDCTTNQEQLKVNKPEAGIFDCNTFCTAKDYESGRNVDDCTYCNTINEVCEVSIGELTSEHCCCMLSEFSVGCNDADFTQTDFDASILTSTHCADDLGTHVDICEGGLLGEWSCPVVGDTCSLSFVNCESFLGDGAECVDGECVAPSSEFQRCDLACANYLGGFSSSIPLADIPDPYWCGDYYNTQCSSGAENVGDTEGCCCWNCN